MDASTDPLIVLMRAVDSDARAVHTQDEDQVQSILRSSGGSIGKALFADKGLSVPPDATFTLRLSYGAVEGYKLDGKQVPWFPPWAELTSTLPNMAASLPISCRKAG